MDNSFSDTIAKLNSIRLKELQERVERLKRGIFDDNHKEYYREDCYFYHKEKDMSATIISCCYDDERYEKRICPCKDCEHYISNLDVSKLVRKEIEERQKG